MATEILFGEGHRSISLVTGAREVGTSQERVDGFLESVHTHRLDRDQCPVFYGDYSVETGHDAIRRIFDIKTNGGGVTAVITASTRITFGAIQELRRRQVKIPDGISLVAYGYSQWLSLFFPPITTVEQSVLEMGRSAARILLDLIEGRSGNGDVNEIIDPVIIDGVSHRIIPYTEGVFL